MAKKEKKEDIEKEDYAFVPPDFDEEAFIHKELVSFQTTVAVVVAGIVAALISWALYGPVGGGKSGWGLGLAIMAVMFAVLRPMYKRFKLDIAHWARREWIGTAFLLFFTWLAFFMIFINPPVSDFAAPTAEVYVGPSIQDEGQLVTLDLFASDNVRIRGVEFDLTGPATAGTADLTKISPGHYRFKLEDAPAGTYSYTFTAKDKKHSTSTNGTFEVLAGGLDVEVGDLTKATGVLFVDAPKTNVWSVYADMGDDRVCLKWDEELGGWKATANFLGWSTGANNFTIVLEEKNRFQGQTRIDGGKVMAGPFNVEVSDPGELKTCPKPQRTDAPVVNVPGLELVGLVAMLGAAAVLARRR